jgi:uncharacterized protein (DUF169 family)
MLSIKECNTIGEELARRLILHSSPIAVRMIESESDIPTDSFRPEKDRGEHYAQCQAFSLTRRNKMTVAMLKDDNWCPGPVVSYGLMPAPHTRAPGQPDPYDSFELGKYIGILTAPMEKAAFIPDVVLIYCDTNQLRNMLLALPDQDRPLVKYNFFPHSCAFSVTSPILDGAYWVNLPDPGEYVRALTQAGEMIFSIPAARMTTFMEQFRTFDGDSRYAHEQMMMQPNFPQMDLYKKIFGAWGMKHTE